MAQERFKNVEFHQDFMEQFPLYQPIIIMRIKVAGKPESSHLYAEFISTWSNQGSLMCLLSILNQQKKYLSYLAHYPSRDMNPTIGNY